MIRCLEYGMLMEVDWLYIVLIIVSVVELMVSLVVNMVGRSRGLVMVIPMMHNWLKVKSFMVGRLKMNCLVMGRLKMNCLVMNWLDMNWLVMNWLMVIDWLIMLIEMVRLHLMV